MEAVSVAARGIIAGEISLAIAGGVESMSRAPFVIPKAASAFSRTAEMYDTTIGCGSSIADGENVRNGVHAGNAENVAEKYKIDRASQDCFALRSQLKAAAAQKAGILAEESCP